MHDKFTYIPITSFVLVLQWGNCCRGLLLGIAKTSRSTKTQPLHNQVHLSNTLHKQNMYVIHTGIYLGPEFNPVDAC